VELFRGLFPTEVFGPPREEQTKCVGAVFDNQSGEPALVKLVGPTSKDVEVANSANLAVFSTCGYGPVPPVALERAIDQDAILECIKAATGIPIHADLLILPTECPIYIFDWKLHDGPYVLVRRPAGGRTPALNLLSDDLLAAVTRMTLDFSVCDAISLSSIPTEANKPVDAMARSSIVGSTSSPVAASPFTLAGKWKSTNDAQKWGCVGRFPEV